MMTLTINGKEYKVKFGYNSFCDTDLLDKTTEVMGVLKGEGIKETANDPNNMAFTRRLFGVTRDLLFEGFKKFNPVDSAETVGNLLDDYYEENPTEHGLINIFGMIAQELLTEGFFGNLLTKSEEAIQKLTSKKVSKTKK